MEPMAWYRYLMLFSLSATMLFSTVASDAGQSPVSGSSEPIKIKSDELQTDTKARTATFTGKVVARQGDVTINADRMVVYYAADSDDLDKVEVFGNVRIIQAGRIGTGGHGVYDSKSGRITLDGSPRVIQGNDSVTGKVITYNLNDASSVVTGGGDSRVEAVIHPKERPSAPRK
jgi:lipopolysaccharide export system protein LptA